MLWRRIIRLWPSAVRCVWAALLRAGGCGCAQWKRVCAWLMRASEGERLACGWACASRRGHRVGSCEYGYECGAGASQMGCGPVQADVSHVREERARARACMWVGR